MFQQKYFENIEIKLCVKQNDFSKLKKMKIIIYLMLK